MTEMRLKRSKKLNIFSWVRLVSTTTTDCSQHYRVSLMASIKLPREAWINFPTSKSNTTIKPRLVVIQRVTYGIHASWETACLDLFNQAAPCNEMRSVHVTTCMCSVLLHNCPWARCMQCNASCTGLCPFLLQQGELVTYFSWCNNTCKIKLIDKKLKKCFLHSYL